MKDLSKINVIDVEATCWKTLEEQGHQIQEIIEIGLAVVDLESLQISDKTSIFVRPQFSTVSKFCTELTSLTQERVDLGVTFAQACDKLLHEFSSRSRLWASWGDFDRRLFARNVKLHNLGRPTDECWPFGPGHLNIKDMFGVLHQRPSTIGLQSALSTLALEFEGKPHSGCDDAYNASAVLTSMIKGYG